MKRGIITIGENGKVHIPTTPVWMLVCEITDLFGVLQNELCNLLIMFRKDVFYENIKTLCFSIRIVW